MARPSRSRGAAGVAGRRALRRRRARRVPALRTPSRRAGAASDPRPGTHSVGRAQPRFVAPNRHASRRIRKCRDARLRPARAGKGRPGTPLAVPKAAPPHDKGEAARPASMRAQSASSPGRALPSPIRARAHLEHAWMAVVDGIDAIGRRSLGLPPGTPPPRDFRGARGPAFSVPVTNSSNDTAFSSSRCIWAVRNPGQRRRDACASTSSSF